MNRQEVRTSWWLSATAVIAWVLANGLDVLSVLFAVRFGNVFPCVRNHPAEYLVIYAGIQLLGTLAVWLMAAAAGRRWSSVSTTVWSALTACALATAIAAWWRLYS